MRVAMRSSLVALVPAIGLCLSKVTGDTVSPRQFDGSQDDPESICITYVTTYLATHTPQAGGDNTGERKTVVRCDRILS